MTVFEAKPTLADAHPVFRLGVDAYHQMIQAGIFDENDRVELIDGELRAMPPINPDHAGKNNRLNRLLTLGVGDARSPRLRRIHWARLSSPGRWASH